LIFFFDTGNNSTFTFGSAVEDQQVGCLWQGNHLLSLNLRGHLSYLDPSRPNEPIRVIKGHNKSIESLAYHKPSNSLYTGSYDAVVTRWNETDGSMEEVAGDGHKNSVIALAIQGDNLVSAAIDDSVRVTPHGADFTYAAPLLRAARLNVCLAEVLTHHSLPAVRTRTHHQWPDHLGGR
jgi:WD40 repeat protein